MTTPKSCSIRLIWTICVSSILNPLDFRPLNIVQWTTFPCNPRGLPPGGRRKRGSAVRASRSCLWWRHLPDSRVLHRHGRCGTGYVLLRVWHLKKRAILCLLVIFQCCFWVHRTAFIRKTMWRRGNADQSDSYCEVKAWWLWIMQAKAFEKEIPLGADNEK